MPIYRAVAKNLTTPRRHKANIFKFLAHACKENNHVGRNYLSHASTMSNLINVNFDL